MTEDIWGHIGENKIIQTQWFECAACTASWDLYAALNGLDEVLDAGDDSQEASTVPMHTPRSCRKQHSHPNLPCTCQPCTRQRFHTPTLPHQRMHTNACTRSRFHTPTHAQANASTRQRMHTHSHTRTRTHAHAHMRTHTQARSRARIRTHREHTRACPTHTRTYAAVHTRIRCIR